MLLARWHLIECCPPQRMAFAAHLHGRDMVVDTLVDEPGWRWQVTTPHGHLLAEGRAPERELAQQAAEDEVEAIHPPSAALIDDLLG